jgi:hypothetical protein
MIVAIQVPWWQRSVLLGRATTAGILTHAAFLQDDFQRAEVCERGLQQVEPDKGGEPEPVWAVVVREDEAQEDEGASKPANDQVHFHKSVTASD